MAGGGSGASCRCPDRRVHLSQGPSARRGVPQHRDPAGERGRHPDPAALGRRLPRAVLPARGRLRPAGGHLQRRARPATSTRPSWPGCWPASAIRRCTCWTAATSSGSSSSGRWCSRYPADPGDALSRPGRSSRRRRRWRRCGARSRSGEPCWWTPGRRISTRAQAGAQMRRGHIPGAINHYWQDDLTQEGFGHVWKPAAELRRATRRRGSRRTRTSSPTATAPPRRATSTSRCATCWAIPRVRIYVGSWTEWAERVELPVEAGGRGGRRQDEGRRGRRGRRAGYPAMRAAFAARAHPPPLRLRPRVPLTSSRSRSAAVPAARSARPA